MGAARNIVGEVVLALALSGCTVLGGTPPPLDTYDLTAPLPPQSGRRHTRAQILIAEPSALKALDSQEIVIKPAAGVIQYLKGAQWADRLPRIVQAKLAEAYQRSGRVGGVGSPGEGLAIDYQIVADIRAFEIRLDGQKRAEVELYVRVLNDRNGVVRASRTFSAASPVTSGDNDAFVAALDRAFLQVAVDIVNWSVPYL